MFDDDDDGDLKLKSVQRIQHFQSVKTQSTIICMYLLTCRQMWTSKNKIKNNSLVLSNLLYADMYYWQENKISNVLKEHVTIKSKKL